MLTAKQAQEIVYQVVSLFSPSGCEAEAAAYLVQQAAKLGWNSWVDAAGNLVAERGSGRPVIYFLGHIDTVPGEIPVRIEDGILHGRGAVDAKGPLTAFLCAASHVDFPGTIRIIGAVEEEAPSSKGAHFAIEHYPAPDFLIIGEPSGWESLTLGYKGGIQVEYAVRQEKTHGASKHPSAGTRAVTFFRALEDLPTLAGITASSPFYSVRRNIKRINTQDDGLYESVEMKLDIRIPPEVDAAQLIDELPSLDPQANVTVGSWVNAVRCPKTGPLVAAFRKAVKQQGGTPRLSLKTGTSDMNLAVPVWQCPCLAYGPGDSDLDHTPHEHLDLAEYQRSIRIIQTMLVILGARTERGADYP